VKRLLLVSLEIILLILCGVITARGLFPLPVLPLFLVAWGSLRARHLKWRDVGLRRPASWPKTIGLAVLIGVSYQFLDIFLISPLLERLTRQPIDLSQFSMLQGSLPALIIFLVLTWTEAAFIEEMFFRGYLYNRLTDLFGKKLIGMAVALILSSLAFGAAHAYQGITGVADTFLAGLVLGLLYLLSGENLWLPILTHGIVDMIGFILVYLGLFTH
jgi:membrane protease YdiL (CAAX protease family)